MKALCLYGRLTKICWYHTWHRESTLNISSPQHVYRLFFRHFQCCNLKVLGVMYSNLDEHRDFQNIFFSKSHLNKTFKNNLRWFWIRQNLLTPLLPDKTINSKRLIILIEFEIPRRLCHPLSVTHLVLNRCLLIFCNIIIC